jgi:hypothetical protein
VVDSFTGFQPLINSLMQDSPSKEPKAHIVSPLACMR